jgi:tetratricopeptide (TPR) repeat protein
MPTKDRKETGRAAAGRRAAPPTVQPRRGEAAHSAAYEAALTEFAAAIERLGRRDHAGALELFRKLESEQSDEPELADRARTYAKICARRLAPAEQDPPDADACYYRAVLLANEGRAAEAIRLLDRAVDHDPTSVRFRYARACAWALEGKVEAAVADLRQAIVGDPRVRFQAANDTDFERIREEPAFIDVIEPTPTGA